MKKSEAYIGFVLFAVNYLAGPFALPMMLSIIKKFYYKIIFFTTAIACVAYMVVFMFAVSYEDLVPLVVVAGIAVSPFTAIYYCVYNYYVKSLAVNNDGVLFGAAYSMFSMNTIAGALYLHFNEQIANLDIRFYIPLLGFSVLVSFLYFGLQEAKPESKEPLSINLEERLQRQVFGTDSIDSEPQVQDYSYTAQLKAIWRLPKVLPNFALLIPNITGMGILGVFSTVFVDSPELLEYPIKCLLYHGTGQFFGGITAGVVSDMRGSLNVLLMIQILAVLAFIQAISAYYCYTNGDASWIDQTYSYQFLTGLLQSSLEATTYSYYAHKYSNNDQMLIFCNWVYCISFCLGCIILELILKIDSTMVYITLAIGIVFIVCNFITLWLFRRKELLLK